MFTNLLTSYLVKRKDSNWSLNLMNYCKSHNPWTVMVCKRKGKHNKISFSMWTENKMLCCCNFQCFVKLTPKTNKKKSLNGTVIELLFQQLLGIMVFFLRTSCCLSGKGSTSLHNESALRLWDKVCINVCVLSPAWSWCSAA